MDLNKRQAHGFAKLVIFAILALFAAITHGADLSKGYAFSGTSPNNKVTPEKLNELVDSGRILTGFYTDKTEETIADSSDIFLFYDTASGSFRKITKGNLITANVAGTTFRNLMVSNLDATTSSVELRVRADEIILRSLSGTARLATSVDITANVTTTGLNGIDSGSVASNTWYYVWVVSDGTNDRVLLSTSAVSPTMPSGYQYKALVGVARYDSSGLRNMIQRGRRVVMNPQTTAVNGSSPGAPFVFEALNIGSSVPGNYVATVQGIVGVVNSVNRHQWIAGYGVGNISTGSLGSNLHAMGVQRFAQPGSTFGAAVAGMYSSQPFSVQLFVTQTIYWTVHVTGADNTIQITGFELNL